MDVFFPSAKGAHRFEDEVLKTSGETLTSAAQVNQMEKAALREFLFCSAEQSRRE